MIIKVINSEISLTASANTINSAVAVRLLNSNTTTSALITRRDNNNNVLGTFTLTPSKEQFVRKMQTDTLASNGTVGVLAVSIAFN